MEHCDARGEFWCVFSSTCELKPVDKISLFVCQKEVQVYEGFILGDCREIYL